MSRATRVRGDEDAIIRVLRASKAAAAAGRMAESDRLLASIAQQAPHHPAVLNELGVRMMDRGAPEQAHALFARASTADPDHPALWANLAGSLKALGRLEEAAQAIERALALEPRHLTSLLEKGRLIEARGEQRNAARIFRNALATLPDCVTPPDTIRAALEHAREAVRKDDIELARAIEARVAGIRERHGGGTFRRVERCLELLTGQRTRYTPQPTFMYFPEIPAVEFFERADFPWLDDVEAATDDIRAELAGVLASDQAGLEPYVAYPDGVPLDQWKELNQSRRWSAYFLWNQGIADSEHLSRCPRTARALAGAPLCDVAERAPNAFFSILDARTHIPPHTGVTNTRLTVHFPLIVPEGCAFRVGGETREWAPGKAWVFDDTIEHEAWNRSDTPRAILIFDIWNPYLTEAERDLTRAATEVIGEYYGVTPEGLSSPQRAADTGPPGH